MTPPLVTVTGTAQVNATPDQAIITVSVTERNTSVDTVRTNVSNKSAALISYLEGQGVDKNDIQTSFISLQPIFNDSTGVETTPDAYESQQSLTFTLKNLNNFDTIIGGLFQNGANSIDGVTFQIANQTTFVDQARNMAIQNAMNIATDLAQAVNNGLGNVYSIQDQTNIPPPIVIPVSSLATAQSGDNGPSVAGGQVTITSTVLVSFNLQQQQQHP